MELEAQITEALLCNTLLTIPIVCWIQRWRSLFRKTNFLGVILGHCRPTLFLFQAFLQHLLFTDTVKHQLMMSKLSDHLSLSCKITENCSRSYLLQNQIQFFFFLLSFPLTNFYPPTSTNKWANNNKILWLKQAVPFSKLERNWPRPLIFKYFWDIQMLQSQRLYKHFSGSSPDYAVIDESIKPMNNLCESHCSSPRGKTGPFILEKSVYSN